MNEKNINEKYQAFICVISNLFGTEKEIELFDSIKEYCGDIVRTLDNSDWNPPKEYTEEMGEKLKTKILILKNKKTISEIEDIKTFCISKENATSVGGKRTFNLNPGYFANDGMFLLSHKPNDSRKRKKLSRYWQEKQYDVLSGKYIENKNTFSEYKNKQLISFFS